MAHYGKCSFRQPELKTDIAIVGAGMAGLSAARALQAKGAKVLVLDKAKGVGGRLATRRIDEISVDHGAQFFTAQHPKFRAEVESWLKQDLCFVWTNGFPQWEKDRLVEPPNDGCPRYACALGMTSLAKHLGRNLEIVRQHTVSEVIAREGSYLLTFVEGGECEARVILCTAPVPQSEKLLGHLFSSATRETLSSVAVVPCLAAIIETTETLQWRGIQLHSGPLRWMGADYTKRTPSPTRKLVVLHADTEFSQAHLEGDLMEAGQLLLEEAKVVEPQLRSAELLQVHRWRYARPEPSLQGLETIRIHPDHAVWLAGDAFGAGKVESAWLSGTAAAEAIASG